MGKLKKLIMDNLNVVVFAILSVGLELYALQYFDCTTSILNFEYPLYILVTMVCLVAMFQSKIISGLMGLLVLVFQSVLLIGCDLLFLANGTVFELSMLKQRNDAIATIEQLSVDEGLVIGCIVVFLVYSIFLVAYLLRFGNDRGNKKIHGRKRAFGYRTAVIVLLAGIKIIPVYATRGEMANDLTALLYKQEDSYQNFGVSSKVIYELSRNDDVIAGVDNLDEIDDYIYSGKCDTSDYFGISKGNNLVMILAESLEWFPFTLYDEDITSKLFPNLSNIISNSVVFDNFYSREKTDTAESLMMIGSNPVGKYTHNDFAENSYPYSIANLFKNQCEIEGFEDVSINSFHQNMGDFYNRNQIHESFGFDSLIDIYDMEAYGVENTWESDQHERNLDSLMLMAMKDEMFSSNQRFFSFWISFSGHGYYKERDNLRDYYDEFDNLGVFQGGCPYEDFLRTYAATVCDFDKAIGIMMTDLEHKGLLENTTIAIVADHNAYYNKLSNYAKGIDNPYEPELYRVPMMIYDKKLFAALEDSRKSTTVSKFTTTSDVVPTLLDILGIEGWKNLYLGTSMLGVDAESIIYSRAYNVFLDDNYFAYSLSDIRFGDYEKESIAEFEKKAIDHLQRLQVINKIFQSDYFSTNEYQYP